MAFDARETFKDDIEKLDEVYGSRIVPDGAPDIRNAAESYLDKIAQQIEENKDNPAKLQELQALALSVTETYFANTGENGGNNNVANLSVFMQDKLKTILGENSTAESKFQELTSKIKEITTPEPAKEPSLVSLEANANEHAKYEAQIGNEARRQFVADEFKSGRFSDASHIDFFLEQYSKDEILINSAEDTAKLEALLAGIDGYEGPEKQMQSLADRMIKSSLTQTVLKAGMSVSTGMAPTPDMMETKNLDLGLTDALKSMEKSGKKDEVYELIDAANKEAIRRRYEGKNPDNHGDPFKPLSEIGQKVQKAQEAAKWYQFKRKRELRKALKGLMEEGYWETKDSHNTLKTSLGWNGLRKTLAGNRTKSFEKDVQKLNTVIELKTQDASMRWMSTNFYKKLKTKTSLLFKKSPEKLTQRLLKNADKDKIETLKAELTERLSNLPTATTKLESRSINTAQGLLEGTLKTIGDYPKLLEQQKKDALNSLQTHTSKADTHAQKFKEGLEEHVARLRKEAQKALSKDPQYLAYVKLKGEKAAAEKFNVEKMITTDKVMDEILKAQGYSTEEIKEIKQKLGMNKEQEEQSRDNETPIEENQEEQTKDKETKENASRPEVRLDSVEREDGKPAEGYAATEEARLNVSEDGSRYDFITKNKDGTPREPTAEEIENMVKSLPENAKITLEDSFSADTQEAILNALQAHGLEIDEEKTRAQIAARREKEEQEEARKKEKENQKADEEQAKKEQGREETGENDKNKTADDAKTPMSMAKVMESVANDAVNNPELAEKKIELLAKINRTDLRAQEGEYTQMLNDISDTFGKDSDETKFLRSMVTNKSMEQELESAGFSKEEKDQYSQFIKENKTTGHEDIKHNTSNRLDNISQVTDLAKTLAGKSDDEVEKALKESSLPAYAKQGVSNLVKLENSDLKPEDKGKLRGQILGRVIEGKEQSKTVTKTVQRTIDPRMASKSKVSTK